jgi:hypothetical protein
MGEIEKQNYFNNETKKIKRVRTKLKKKYFINLHWKMKLKNKNCTKGSRKKNQKNKEWNLNINN